MKNIKNKIYGIFNNNNNPINKNVKYWKIPTTEPQLEIVLNKLKDDFGCDITKKDLYFRSFNTPKPKFNKKLYIVKSITPINITIWSFLTNNRIAKKYKFMGELTVSLDDIEKFIINKDITKYNL